MKTYDILGLGIGTIDDLTYVEHFPLANTKVPALSRERHCGGLTMTALVAAARLGARCAYAGQLGHDADSREVLAVMAREQIDISHVVFLPDARPVVSTIIVGEAEGTRNIFPLHSPVEGAHPSLPEAEVIRAAKVLFVDHIGIPGQTRAARISREAGCDVVGDIENKSVLEHRELFDRVNHLIMSEEFAALASGSADPVEAVQRLFSASRSLVAVTQGPLGCWFQFDDAHGVLHQPAFPVNVIDTTGCGDVFHGAYAAALALGLPPAERIRFASAAAALKATRRGGQAGAPTRAQLDALL